MEKNLPYRIMQIGINFKSQVHIWYFKKKDEKIIVYTHQF